MLHSHFVNIANPCSYIKTFNDLMKANNLPVMNFPEEPPSLEIITRLSVAANVESGPTASLHQSEKEKEILDERKDSLTHLLRVDPGCSSTSQAVEQAEKEKKAETS